MSGHLALKPTEISELIKSQISSFETEAEIKSEGTVVSVKDGIVRLYGLTDVMSSEMLEFENGATGMALNLERDSVGAVVLGAFEDIQEGNKVKCTGKVLSVPVGRSLLGRVVDALGNPIDGKEALADVEFSKIEKVAPGVIDRQSVNEPIQTGLKAIDSMVPIGKGQRELIIGDRQTGKTAIAIDTIISQKNTGVKCIYVAIGQKAS